MRGRAGVPRVLLTFAIPWAWGCAGPENPGATAVADSAGVEIVFSSRPTHGPGAWSISDRPVLEIRGGTTDADPPLYQVTGIAFAPGGGLVVANRSDGTLRSYDRAGALVWSAGGIGEGPGEFTDLRGVERQGSRVWAYQSLPRPAKVFDLAGALVEVVGTGGATGPRLQGFLTDGSQIVVGRGTGAPSGRVWTESAPILKHGATGVDTIAVLPYRRVVDIGRLGAEAQALGPFLQVAVGGGWIYAGYPEEWDIQVLMTEGSLTRRIRRSWQPSPVTGAHAASWRAALVESGAGMGDAAGLYRELSEAMVLPTRHPAFDRLLVADSGELWVRRTQTEPPWSEGLDYNPVPHYETSWDVFDHRGVWSATVVLPARFRLMAVSTDALAGIAKNDLDVERVQVWAIHRGP